METVSFYQMKVYMKDGSMLCYSWTFQTKGSHQKTLFDSCRWDFCVVLLQPFVFVGSDKEWRAADQLVSSVVNLKVENISDIMVTKTEENV